LDGTSTSSLTPLFGAWASRVRARLALRRALTGATLGLALAVVVASVAWKVRRADVRIHAAWLGLAGAAIGLAVARRRRWSDGEVALFLDARLASSEVIATAIDLDRGRVTSAGNAIVARAVEALASGDTRRARPRLFAPAHAAMPVALLALAAITRLPLPPAPASTTTPGESRVTLAQVEGLEAIAKLAQVSARDDAQRERLAAIARDAAALRERLRASMDRRDAQDRVARLREAIDTERLSLGDGPKRAGLESAVSRLEQTRATRSAARALGDHDLQEMDEETSRIANAREKQDRALADAAMDEAARAARGGGASDVGAALDAERQLLGKRAAQADALREMADALKQAGALGDDAQRALDSLDREGSESSARELAKALAEAWSKLTPEEKARLAAKMAKHRAQATAAATDSAAGNAPPPDAKQLEEELRAMANDDTESDEARRQAALDAAGAGAGQAEASLGGSGAGAGGNKGGGGNANGDGTGGGGGHDFGTGSHTGATAKLDGETLKSRAQAHLNAAAAMPSSVTTFTPGRPGDVATALTTGDLRAVGSGELDGVEKSDVPQEYRDHVRQYFNPGGGSTAAKDGPR
jgi:hypothetical protein